MINGRRQPSRGGTSRMTREYQVRFCEGLGVKFPGPTRQKQTSSLTEAMSALPRKQTLSDTTGECAPDSGQFAPLPPPFNIFLRR